MKKKNTETTINRCWFDFPLQWRHIQYYETFPNPTQQPASLDAGQLLSFFTFTLLSLARHVLFSTSHFFFLSLACHVVFSFSSPLLFSFFLFLVVFLATPKRRPQTNPPQSSRKKRTKKKKNRRQRLHHHKPAPLYRGKATRCRRNDLLFPSFFFFPPKPRVPCQQDRETRRTTRTTKLLSDTKKDKNKNYPDKK